MIPAKVVIVEEDPSTIRTLENEIDWKKLGCEPVGTASDGETGRELILNAKPDILLTGIHIPGLDGLKMAEDARKTLPELIVIVLTESSRFEDALRAIRLGVFDYLQKPVSVGETENALRRALEQRMHIRSDAEAAARADRYLARAQLLSLLSNMSHTGQDVSRMMDEAGLSCEAYYLMIFQPEEGGSVQQHFLDGIGSLVADDRIPAVSVLLHDTVVLYIRRHDNTDVWMDEAKTICTMARRRVRTGMHIGISRLETSKHRIRQSYQEARQALYENAMDNGPAAWAFYDADADHGGQLSQMRNRVERLAEQADLTDESADAAAAELLRLSGSQYGQMRALVSLYAMLLSKKYPSNQSAAVDRALSLTWFVNSEEQIASGLRQVCAALREGQGPAEDHCSLLTRNVLDYIRLHGADKLTLNGVADRFHVSANYLSALVRKETGITFHNHIINVKLDIAHTMLADPRILVEEVAYAVGYSNYVSFYNVFKQKEGMTPTEYRNRIARL
ncbi:MAG: helix-turn-helix domain-containing protein [Clostridia bacterium]|nr:helix-turn-helix domain-containing protein [Clostridia bacterium]